MEFESFGGQNVDTPGTKIFRICDPKVGGFRVGFGHPFARNLADAKFRRPDLEVPATALPGPFHNVIC